jgi:hypothetical protein
LSQVSKSERCKLGLSVGGAFSVFGRISWHRGHDIAPRVLWALRLLPMLPGAVVPALRAPIQDGWMTAAAALGHVNTRIFLTVFFYIGLTPIGVVTRLVPDPLIAVRRGRWQQLDAPRAAADRPGLMPLAQAPRTRDRPLICVLAKLSGSTETERR